MSQTTSHTTQAARVIAGVADQLNASTERFELVTVKAAAPRPTGCSWCLERIAGRRTLDCPSHGDEWDAEPARAEGIIYELVYHADSTGAAYEVDAHMRNGQLWSLQCDPGLEAAIELEVD